MENILIVKIILSFKDVILGTVGGMVSYLFDYNKAKRNGDEEFIFMVSSMLVNMALGAFVAYLVGSTLEEQFAGRDAVVALSGVTAYQILLIAESRFATWVVDKITGSGNNTDKK